MTYPGVKTFRGATLEEVLPRIRAELGDDAIVVAQRDGIVGGFAGFFGRRCVEVDAAPAALGVGLAMPLPPVYGTLDVYDSDLPARGVEEDDEPLLEPVMTPEPELEAEPFEEPAFAGILAGFEQMALPEPVREARPVRTAPAPLIAPDAPEIEPAVMEELTIRHTLAAHGFRPRSIESALSLAFEHVRPLAPDMALEDIVRSALRGALETPRGWTAKRKTIVLAGVEGSATAEVAAGLAASYAAAGKRVALLGLAGPRAAVSLAMGTDDVDVSFGICDEPDDVPRVLERLGEVQILIAVAPAFGDRPSAERIGAMVAPLGRVETHLVLPAATPSEEAVRAHTLLERGTRVHCLLPTGVDSARATGGMLALALEATLAIRWTTDLEIGGQPTPADACALVRRVLP